MEAFYLINWLALAICFAFSRVLGVIWYNPQVFGGMWANAIGLQDGDFDIRNRRRSLISSLIYNLLAVYGLAVLLKILGVTAPYMGLAIGVFVAFFFTIAPMGNTAALEQWRAARIVIHGAYRLVQFGASGALLAWWI